MAIKKASEVKERTWNKSIFFPKDNYVLRITDEVKKPSSAGNPMVVLEFEIIECPRKKIGDDLVDFNGVKWNTWNVTKVNPDKDTTPEEAAVSSQKAFDRYNEFLAKCGVEVAQKNEGWDDENPPSVKGKIVYASCYGLQVISRKSPTPEQKAKKEEGDILIDPITGKEVITWKPQIEQIYGVYDKEVKTSAF